MAGNEDYLFGIQGLTDVLHVLSFLFLAQYVGSSEGDAPTRQGVKWCTHSGLSDKGPERSNVQHELANHVRDSRKGWAATSATGSTAVVLQTACGNGECCLLTYRRP